MTRKTFSVFPDTSCGPAVSAGEALVLNLDVGSGSPSEYKVYIEMDSGTVVADNDSVPLDPTSGNFARNYTSKPLPEKGQGTIVLSVLTEVGSC